MCIQFVCTAPSSSGESTMDGSRKQNCETRRTPIDKARTVSDRTQWKKNHAASTCMGYDALHYRVVRVPGSATDYKRITPAAPHCDHVMRRLCRTSELVSRIRYRDRGIFSCMAFSVVDHFSQNKKNARIFRDKS